MNVYHFIYLICKTFTWLTFYSSPASPEEPGVAPIQPSLNSGHAFNNSPQHQGIRPDSAVSFIDINEIHY